MGNFKNELHNFQNVPRDLVFDSSLSDRARFVYLFMACKPEGWDFFLEPMAKDIGYSTETLRKYINELVASGWLLKGAQQNENGKFGAVEYILVASKTSDTEKVRLGKIMAQENKEDCDINENKKKEKTIDKKKELFEECWIAYNRKGSKKVSFEQWCKLSDKEKESVMQHIKAYTQVRERVYQKDFERYLRDKVFTSVVYSGNNVVYDPTKEDSCDSVYRPICGGALNWNDYYQKYMYIGNFDGFISDGYTDENRPDGATIMLNNGSGNITWNKNTKQWEKV